MKSNSKIVVLVFLLSFTLYACVKENKVVPEPIPPVSATEYEFPVPQGFPSPFIPSDNPLTNPGVALGRRLFFDPILSGDNTKACASCHSPSKSFTDTARFSVGIHGDVGTRNSMPLFNIAWNIQNKFFWDGRATGLEQQALLPVTNPIEMDETWSNAVAELQSRPDYVNQFKAAFGTTIIDSILVAKALAQFQRTLISSNSRFDRYLRGELALTPEEASGINVFMDESKGDCFHCHGSPASPFWTDNIFHNNGLDDTFTDFGLEEFTNDPNDRGKFKTPSLRNLAYTAPYMHDGRFNTIDEVINFYSEGLKYSATLDPLMKKVGQGGAQLSPVDKANLKAFLLSLSDDSFVNNPNFQAP